MALMEGKIMGDNGEKDGSIGGEVGILRKEDIDQLGVFISLAAQDDGFRTELDLSVKTKDRQRFTALMTKHGLVDTDGRYYGFAALYFYENGVIFEKLRDFSIAFGHKNVGTLN
jgi:hypothetical protein